MSSAVVAAARLAIGVRFRLHGRDPAYGLDCVGLAALAIRAGAISTGANREGAIRAGGGQPMIPTGYALRSGDSDAAGAMIEAAGLIRADHCRLGPQPGDLLLCRAGPGQLHLVIDSGAQGGGFIHADAQLRRVVERPGPPPWPIIGRWRLAKLEE